MKARDNPEVNVFENARLPPSCVGAVLKGAKIQE
jgi:hypothetical protein